MTPVTNLHTTIHGEGFLFYTEEKRWLGFFESSTSRTRQPRKNPHPHPLNDDTTPRGSRQVALLLSTNNGELVSPWRRLREEGGTPGTACRRHVRLDTSRPLTKKPTDTTDTTGTIASMIQFSNRTSTAIHTPSAQHDKQDKPAGMCTTPYRESRRTAATLQTVTHSSFGGEGAPTRPSRPSRPSRLFTGKRGLGQKPERRTRINTKPPLPSLPFNMIFSFRLALRVYHVGRARESARRQARGHFSQKNTPGSLV